MQIHMRQSGTTIDTMYIVSIDEDDCQVTDPATTDDVPAISCV